MARTERNVPMISNTQTEVAHGAARCCGAFQIIALVAAVAVTTALGGCGTSSSHQADVQAKAASTRASMLLLNAGRYHPKANFPVSISVPLNSGQLHGGDLTGFERGCGPINFQSTFRRSILIG